MNETMAREIAAQAEILPASVAPLAERIATIARPRGRIFAGGCGDSAFAPAALAGVFDALGLEVAARTSMHLAAFQRFVPSDTVILSSISGGTRRTVDAAHAARARSARVIAVTCKAESPLALAADDTVVLPFTPISRKTPHTLDYGMTLLALTQLALAWSDAGEGAPLLDRLPARLDTARQTAVAITARVSPQGTLYFLGAGPDLATAEYAAAKFHEAGGLPAFAFETENFVHGANFMVEPEDGVLALAGNPASLRRGTEVVDAFRGYVASAELIVPPAFDGVGWQKVFADLLSTTFVAQHLCLAVADGRGLAVAEPRAGRAGGDALVSIQARIMSS